jgi:hypothetical protein
MKLSSLVQVKQEGLFFSFHLYIYIYIFISFEYKENVTAQNKVDSHILLSSVRLCYLSWECLFSC